MTKSLFICGLLLFISLISNQTAQAQKQNDRPFWLDETKNEENRLPMHASFFIYPNENEAIKDQWESSENNLN